MHPWKIRPALTSDHSFITSCWFREERNPALPFALFKILQDRTMQAILERAFTIVACNPEDQDQIYGFIVGEQFPYGLVKPPVIHFLYVKAIFRGHGVGKLLMRSTIEKADQEFYYTSKKFRTKTYNHGEYVPQLRNGDFYNG